MYLVPAHLAIGFRCFLIIYKLSKMFSEHLKHFSENKT